MNAGKHAVRQSAPVRPHMASESTAVAPPRRLAQCLGNQALHHLLRQTIAQAKLTVSHPSDAYEREADAVADAVMRMTDRAPPQSELGERALTPRIQRLCPKCEELQRNAVAEPDAALLDQAASVIEPYVNTLSGRGEPLASSTRGFFEPRFGMDFSAVRIHTGPDADHSAKTIDAVAYATGPHIVFRAGNYDPASERGRKLLAHELAHVVQQGAAADFMTDPPAPAPSGGDSIVAREEEEHVSGRFRHSPEPRSLTAEFSLGSQTDDWLITETELIHDWLERRTASSEAEEHLLSVLATAGQVLFNRHPNILNEVTQSVSEDADDGSSLALLGPPVTRVGVIRAGKLAEIAKTIPRVPATGGGAAAAAGGGISLAGLVGWAFLVFVFFAPRGEYISPAHQERIANAIAYAASKQRARSAATPTKRPTKEPTPMNVPESCVRQAEKLAGESGCNFVAIDPKALPFFARNEQIHPQASAYCGSVTNDEPCEYAVYPPHGAPGRVAPWAVFDAFDGGSLIECKCGYDDFVDRADEAWARRKLDDLIGQLTRHLDHSRNCGWPYRVIVSSYKLAEYVRMHGPYGLAIETVQSDMCD